MSTKLLLVAAGLQVSHACTNMMVTPGASADGSTIFSYSCDGYGFPGTLSHSPAGNGDMNVIGLVNEHAVAIGETTFDGLEQLSGSGKYDYYQLMKEALKTATSAKEMITIMDDLVGKDGYGATGESFTIGDTEELWHMELIGKGKWDKGWVWVAVRVPDGYVGGHANQARIRTFSLNDPENVLYSHDVIDFAVSIGLYPKDAPKEEFSFADVYDPISFSGARRCDARVWSFFSQVAEPDFEKKYEDYVLGKNLSNRMPLFVKPVQKVNLTSFFQYMRNHYENTVLDPRNDVSAGAYHSEFRPPPNEWKSSGHSYVNERPVGVPYAAFHYTAQLRGWLPKPIGALNWFAADDSSFSARAPFHGCTTRVPSAYSAEKGKTFNFDSAFWVNSMVANFAYYRYDHVAPRVLEKVKDYEKKFIEDVAEEDKKALAMWKENSTAAVEFLTATAEERGNGLVRDWLSFYQQLFTDFMDGLTPSGMKQGYSQDWYDRVAHETGDRYKQPEDAMVCEHEQRKVKLLNRAGGNLGKTPKTETLTI